ncbi:YdbC family protein [Chengkuizengella sp. SCS-71B]|uniref:YdbC family protein n=1 Tax=Chengkuizengella sp. SCS-71B TaxID=3115290 RepID=UPI0032C23C2C
MAEIKFEILKTIATLSESPKGWKKEFNLISWNGRDPKYDIRDWAPDHTKMGKGVTLSNDEVKLLQQVLKEIDF